MHAWSVVGVTILVALLLGLWGRLKAKPPAVPRWARVFARLRVLTTRRRLYGLTGLHLGELKLAKGPQAGPRRAVLKARWAKLGRDLRQVKRNGRTDRRCTERR